ncbi:two-component system sensor histidine kinase NtrB [Desulfocastanea catecholica]
MTIRQKAESKGNLLFNFSPWLLAIACTLLLILLTIFAVSNYQREKELIVEAIAQKGLTLMRFINSSVRESIRDNLRTSRQWDHWQDHMQAAMEQAVEQPGVEFVVLIDAAGTVLSGAGKNLPENTVDADSLAFAGVLRADNAGRFVTRIIKDADKDKKKFQIAAWYMPPTMRDALHGPPDGSPRRGQMMMRGLSQHPQFGLVQQEMERLLETRPIYIVQLDFEQFNSPLNRQLLQIIILLVVIFLVGLGGTLSFATLKGLKGSQRRLGKMTAFTDMLVSSLPIGLIATDSSDVIQVYNDSAKELIGSATDKVIGGRPQLCLPAKLAQMFSGKEMGGPIVRQTEIHLTRLPEKDQTLQLASMVVLDDSGGFAGEVLLIRDLTTVKRLEKELRRSERLAALGKMAAGVAHELRNPLSSIKGLAVVLKSNFSHTSKEAETADILVKEVERLNRSIGELLDYAKPAQLKRERASVTEIIEKTVSLVQVDAESFGIALRLEMDDDLPQVMLDKDKMNQVFLNLFLNAIQAMEDGGELLVATEHDARRILITVRDNGVGILPENLGRVFDPYFTTKNDGTGLGLAMSAKIVEEHGGWMELSSVAGSYTEVRVILPLPEDGV